MNSSSLLLFDLGGVLIESAAFENLGRLLPEPAYPNHVKQRWLFSPSVQIFECGLSSDLEFAASFVKEWNLTISANTFLDEFSTWPRAFFPGAKELVRELKQQHRVGCLSNSNPLHWEKFSDELASMFDIILSSHVLGSVKPNPDIFLKTLEKCSVQADEIYFFDDCLANVQTAQSLNINAFCVSGFASLVHTLQVQGLLHSSALPNFPQTVFCNA